jgi:hypothetical protein
MKLEDLKLGDLSDMEYRYMLTDKYNAQEELFLSWDRIMQLTTDMEATKKHELYALVQHISASSIALCEQARKRQ